MGPTTAGGVRLDERNAAGFSATVQAIGTLCSLPRRSFEFPYPENPNGQSYPGLSWPSEEFRIIGSR